MNGIQSIKGSMESLSSLVREIEDLKEVGSREEIKLLVKDRLNPLLGSIASQSQSLKEEVTQVTNALTLIKEELDRTSKEEGGLIPEEEE